MNAFNEQFFNENGTMKVNISDIEELNLLLSKKEELRSYSDYGWMVEAHGHIDEFLQDLGGLPHIPSVFSHLPVFPLEESYYEQELQNQDRYKKLLLPFGGITAFFLLLFFVFHVGFFNTLSVIGIFATAFIGYKFYSNHQKYNVKKKAYDMAMTTYQETLGAFRSALATYEQDKEQAIEAARTYGQQYKETYQKYQHCIAVCAVKKKKAVEELETVEQQIGGYDFAPAEYHTYIPTVLMLLKSGRADDYKEALNMAIEEEHRRMEEEERRQAELRQEALMRQQIEEERRHNEQMEKEAMLRRKQEQDNMMYQQRQQEKADQKARSEQAHREAEAMNDARRRCATCANRKGCHTPIVNCGAYRADNAHRL